MAKYRCRVCGYIYDEEEKELRFLNWRNVRSVISRRTNLCLMKKQGSAECLRKQELKLEYPKEFVRHDESMRYMKEIHEMAVTGKSISAAMGTRAAHARLG